MFAIIKKFMVSVRRTGTFLVFYIFKYIAAKNFEWLKINYEKGDTAETVYDVWGHASRPVTG